MTTIMQSAYEVKKGIFLKNRAVMAPMTTWAANENGTLTKDEIKYYDIRTKEVGLTITGCAHVHPSGQGFYNEFAGYDDFFLEGLTELASTIKKNDSLAILQIFHAGSRAIPSLVPNQRVVSASKQENVYPFGATTEALSEAEIMEIIQAFGNTTKRAIEAGFDGVEIHGAHEFLLQNFFSPLTNKREDQWGGNLHNRLRFPREVIQEVRNAANEMEKDDFIIGYRFSPEEVHDGGIRMSDSKELVEFLIKQDIDFIHASLDDYRKKAIGASPNEETRLKQIIDCVDHQKPLIVAGAIYTSQDVEEVLDLGVDLVGIGKSLVLNPDWVSRINQDEPIEKVLKYSELTEKKIPLKMWEAILSVPNWFDTQQ